MLSSSHIRVACVGDSNVNGFRGGLFGGPPSRNAWPQSLQRILGEGYEVVNLGSDGATIQKHTVDVHGEHRFPAAYWERDVFQTLTSARWDIIVIMIGGNDTKMDFWKGEEEFAAAYTEFITLARTLGRSAANPPSVYVCTCGPLLTETYPQIQTATVNRVLPKLLRRIAAANKAPLIEIFTAMGGDEVVAGALPKAGLDAEFVMAHPESLPARYYYADFDESVRGVWCDQVHPADAGFIRMAEVIAEHIKTSSLVGRGALVAPPAYTTATTALVTLSIVVAMAVLIWRRR